MTTALDHDSRTLADCKLRFDMSKPPPTINFPVIQKKVSNITIFDDPQIEIDAQHHAMEEYPFESVGGVIRGRYHKFVNLAKDKGCEFKVAWVDGVEALIHSHPDELPHPSRIDMAQQQASGLPWAIVGMCAALPSKLMWFGDTVPTRPYLKRLFVSGVTDCWTLVRDWYRQERSIVLDNPPRDWNWRQEQVNLMSSVAIEKTGLVEVKQSELQFGDILMMRLGSQRLNHAGIYTEQGLLHQPMGRYSVVEPVERWFCFTKLYLRPKSA